MHGHVEAAKEYEFRDVAIFDEADMDTAGIFSLATQGEKLVAGDFSMPGQSSRAAVSISRDGGSTWTQPGTPTYGYR